jgi:hypothetical protein
VTLFSLVLFLHVASALLMFATLALEAVALTRLGRALTPHQVRNWLDLASGHPAAGVASAVFLFLSGGYMAGQLVLWELAWPKIAVLSLVLLALLGAVAGRSVRTIRRSLASWTEHEVFRKLHHPILRISLGVRIGLMFGILFLMTAQPGVVESAGVVAICASLGLSWALLRTRRRSPSGTGAEPDNLQVSD